MSDSLDLARVVGALSNAIYADKIHYLASVTSTNTLALEAAQNDAPHGSIWIADEQTSGRGRSDHTWHSSRGEGLYVSILLRPHMPIKKTLLLSLATGIAAQSAIAAVTGLAPDIRWPNDLLIGEKKCGGILVETSTAPNQPTLRYAVIGIGINLNHTGFPKELQSVATSLYLETGQPLPREQLLIQLLLAIEAEIDLLEAESNNSFSKINLLDRFAATSTWVRGKPVIVEEAGGYTGVTEGLDADGFLRVRGEDNVMHTVLSGGVRARYGNESGR
ncbi:MAG TPA: biotin--[acetyl-CoA-carboxylase] ligase [Edaphobacter sp.]|nr:biotin--[acetyl-CoA-carboxylase] ligase [Edaphobacter sp.]